MFLREHKDVVKILSKRRQDLLGTLDGDGKVQERNEVEERNGGWRFMG